LSKVLLLVSIYEAFWADEMKQPLNPLEPSSVPSSSWMDEIRLFTATRAAATGIATAGAMAAAVNEASPEAGRIYYIKVLGWQAEAKVADNYKLSTPMTLRTGTDYSHEKVIITQHWSVTSSKPAPTLIPTLWKTPYFVTLGCWVWRQPVK
jgi:hypothetical protein